MIQQGHEREWVFDLDLESFASLHESCERIDAKKSIEEGWRQMIAAQGQHKMMKDWLDRFEQLLRDGKQNDDVSRFIRDVGGGW